MLLQNYVLLKWCQNDLPREIYVINEGPKKFTKVEAIDS
jgi:hypothetical protein